MRRIAYVGAGRLAEQLASLLDPSPASGSFQSLFFGQPSEGGEKRTVLPFERYLDEEFSDCAFYLALGYHQIRRKRSVLQELRRKGRRMPCLIHSTAYVHPSAKIAEGCVVYPGVVIGPGCSLDGGVLLNSSVNLAHDVLIGEASYLGPSAAVSGFCRIGAETFLGTGVLLSNDVSVGQRCRLGIGSVVTHSLPDDTQGMGNPFQLRAFDLI